LATLNNNNNNGQYKEKVIVSMMGDLMWRKHC